MAAKTAGDILAEAKYFHRHLGAFYELLRHTVATPKVQLILEYLCRHEDRMEEMLRNYEEGMAKKIANTWFKSVPGDSVDACIAAAEVKPDMSLDELMAIALKFEDCFINLYRHVADQAVSDEVREVFETLEKESLKDRANLARNLVNMQDL